MGFYRGPTIVRDGLVLYLDAANPKSYPGSGVDWKDLSGINNGTLMNGPTFNSDKKGSILLDGVSDYVESSSSDSLKMTSGLTICVNFSVKEMVEGLRYVLIGKHYSEYEVMILPGGGVKTYTGRGISGGGAYDEGISALNPGGWINGKIYHLSYTLSGLTETVYIDSKFIRSLNKNNYGTYPGSYPLNIGKRVNSTNFLNGNVYNACVYNRALNQDEVLQNYNATKTRFK